MVLTSPFIFNGITAFFDPNFTSVIIPIADA